MEWFGRRLSFSPIQHLTTDLERDDGKKELPLRASILVADYLRRAAPAAGVQIAQGHRFGTTQSPPFTQQLAVNKAKVEPKTVQGILRHSKIQTTLDFYTQEESDEARAAQGSVSGGGRLQAGGGAVSCGLNCGLDFWGDCSLSL